MRSCDFLTRGGGIVPLDVIGYIYNPPMDNPYSSAVCNRPAWTASRLDLSQLTGGRNSTVHFICHRSLLDRLCWLSIPERCFRENLAFFNLPRKIARLTREKSVGSIVSCSLVPCRIYTWRKQHLKCYGRALHVHADTKWLRDRDT